MFALPSVIIGKRSANGLRYYLNKTCPSLPPAGQGTSFIYLLHGVVVYTRVLGRKLVDKSGMMLFQLYKAELVPFIVLFSD